MFGRENLRPDYDFHFGYFLLLLIIGILFGYIISLLLYGFGQLIENTEKTEKTEKDVKAVKVKK